MARPREFDTDAALDGAIKVFSEHGFEGTSTQMLVDKMGIARQSLYAAFGDKWGLYCSAVRRYGSGECASHFDALRSGAKAVDGITAMLRRVVSTASEPCLGVGSTYEFGDSQPELQDIRERLAKSLKDVIVGRVRDAQAEGGLASDVAPEAAADFLVAAIAGIRVAGRGGAKPETLSPMVDIALRALR